MVQRLSACLILLGVHVLVAQMEAHVSSISKYC